MSDPLSRITNGSLARREFLISAAAVGAGMSFAAPEAPGGEASLPQKFKENAQLHIAPRYHRWHVDPGVDWIETNTAHATLDWTIPLEQAALVLVDVWDHHYLKDAEARAESIINERFVPLLAECRKAGLTIIHAPSPPHAERHANWIGNSKPPRRPATADDWPPPAFRSKSGPFAPYRRPEEPREAELALLRSQLQIHPQVMPVGNEPVVATGDELHEVCRSAGILFLFFAGFNTNACILVRDYGTLAMSGRGYEVILLRDCTTGMESRDSQPTLAQTNGAILFLEMFGQYTMTSEELRAGLPL
ncbi:MAG: isochorismatase family protein [Planctomycetaceae bacterium]|nr:isochorismatase family protein [Planctomycetaceae bacterium]